MSEYCTMTDPNYMIMLKPIVVCSTPTVVYSEINFDSMSALKRIDVNLIKNNDYCKISKLYRFKRLFYCCCKKIKNFYLKNFLLNNIFIIPITYNRFQYSFITV